MSLADTRRCGACGAEIQPGALRCYDCNAPFAGPNRVSRLRAGVDELHEGVGMAFRVEEEAVLRPPGLPVAILPTDARTPLAYPARCSRCGHLFEPQQRILAVFVPEDGVAQLVLYCGSCELAAFTERADPFDGPLSPR